MAVNMLRLRQHSAFERHLKIENFSVGTALGLNKKQ